MMGRRALPTNVKELRGTIKKIRLVENEPEPELVVEEDLEAPSDLEGIAYQVWTEYSKSLMDTRVLTKTDVHNLEAFCRWWAIWKQAEQVVREEGVTITTQEGARKNPAVTVMNDASRNIVQFGAVLGLDPSSRTKISAKKVGKKGNFADL